jgi:hypothetical protein
MPPWGLLGLVLVCCSLCLPVNLSAQAATFQPGSVNSSLDAELLFRFPAGGAISYGPIIAADTIWFQTDARILYIMKMDGTLVGRRILDFRQAAYIVCDSFGRAVLPENPHRLVLVNRAGQTVWSIDIGRPLDGPPVFGPDGRIYVAVDGQLISFAANGLRLWTIPLPAAIDWQRPLAEFVGSAQVRGKGTEQAGGIMVGPGGGPLVAFVDGTIRAWSEDSVPLWSITTSQRPLRMASSQTAVALAMPDGSIQLFDARGMPIGLVNLASPAVALVLSGSGHAYTMLQDGRVAALDPSGVVWQTTFRPGYGGGTAALMLSGQRIMALWQSSVVSYDLDGGFQSELRIRNPGTMPAIGLNGAVVTGGGDWILYAYAFESNLSPLAPRGPGRLEYERILMMAREEAAWTPGGLTDDVLLAILNDIEKTLKSGTIGKGADRAAHFAAAIALGRLEAPFGLMGVSAAGAGLPIPGSPLPRIMACSVLGLLGSPRSIPTLVDVFLRDPEPTVRVSAIMAIGTIGLDPTGLAMGAMAGAAAAGMDTRTASATIETIERLYRSNGGLDNPAGALALVRLAGTSYSGEVRTRAEQALRKVAAPR